MKNFIIVSDIFNVLIFQKNDDFIINNKLIEIYNRFPQTKRVLFTSALLNIDSPSAQPFIKNFEQLFSTKEIGFSKSDHEAYLHLAKRLEVKPNQLIFIDDKDYHIKAAEQAGLNGIVYKSNQQTLIELEGILGDSN